MTDIQICYLERYCEKSQKIIGQCYSDAAKDLECRNFICREKYVDENGIIFTSFSSCAHAKYKEIYKGMNIKNYKLEKNDDIEDEYFGTMTLETRNRIYACTKVILNNTCIFQSNKWEDA